MQNVMMSDESEITLFSPLTPLIIVPRVSLSFLHDVMCLNAEMKDALRFMMTLALN